MQIPASENKKRKQGSCSPQNRGPPSHAECSLKNPKKWVAVTARLYLGQKYFASPTLLQFGVRQYVIVRQWIGIFCDG
jgi:hypothetical protein